MRQACRRGSVAVGTSGRSCGFAAAGTRAGAPTRCRARGASRRGRWLCVSALTVHGVWIVTTRVHVRIARGVERCEAQVDTHALERRSAGHADRFARESRWRRQSIALSSSATQRRIVALDSAINRASLNREEVECDLASDAARAARARTPRSGERVRHRNARPARACERCGIRLRTQVRSPASDGSTAHRRPTGPRTGRRRRGMTAATSRRPSPGRALWSHRLSRHARELPAGDGRVAAIEEQILASCERETTSGAGPRQRPQIAATASPTGTTGVTRRRRSLRRR